MAILKWRRDEKWCTFYYGAFENIKKDLKNIILAINNMAAAVRARCRRDKNLSDLTDAASGRTNLGLINDCSALSRAPHHHDSRYTPLINDEAEAREEADADLLRQIEELENRMNSLVECKCKK